MNYIIIIIFLSLNCNPKNHGSLSQATHILTDTILSKKTTPNSGTPLQMFTSGFYLTTLDTAKSKGVKLVNKDEYYLLDSVPIVPIIYIDSIYKEYNRYSNSFILVFKFNHIATRNWASFTMENKGRKVGLVIDNQLFNVVTITSAIPDGVTALQLPYTEQEIDDLKKKIEKEKKLH